MTVIGVSPPGFDGLDPGQSVDLRVPLAMQGPIRGGRPGLPPRDAFELNVVARVRSGVRAEQAQQAIGSYWARYLEAEGRKTAERLELRPTVTGFGRTRAQLETALWALFALTGAVLLVACLNLGNLFLARAQARRREMSVRLALGAGRGRLARQLLTESLLLAVLGGLLGVGLALAGAELLADLATGGASRVSLEVRPGLAVLVFHVAVVTGSGVLFGLAPALRAGRADALAGLKAAPAGESRPDVGGRRALVVAQVALSVLALVAAGLFTRSVASLRSADHGFRPERLLLVALDPKTAGRADGEVLRFYRDVRARVAALPGVDGVTFATARAFAGPPWRAAVVVEGSRRPPSTEPALAARNAVGPDYFRTFAIPIVAGRDLTEADDALAPKVAVINEELARIHFGDDDPLGRRIGQEALQYTIVGVVRDRRGETVREPPSPRWYVPYEQRAGTKHLDLSVRTAGPAEAAITAVRRAIAEVDGRVPLFEVRSQEQQLDIAISVERMLAGLATGFGATAAALSALGLYGVLGLVVAARRREFALRMALGAQPADVLRAVAGRATAWVASGLVGGLLLATALGHAVRSLLHGVSPLDPASFLGGGLAVVVTAAVAALLPARRAAATDPMAVLREP
jgi:predicted permease